MKNPTKNLNRRQVLTTAGVSALFVAIFSAGNLSAGLPGVVATIKKEIRELKADKREARKIKNRRRRRRALRRICGRLRHYRRLLAQAQS